MYKYVDRFFWQYDVVSNGFGATSSIFWCKLHQNLPDYRGYQTKDQTTRLCALVVSNVRVVIARQAMTR
ncbi:MAG: hypothetical protein ACJA1F_000384 [Paracoccaceae bacterium]|jgi:hypothetical protein